ncbi:MAG: DNA (cytosine-5-)-methyltransferase, partial [Sedimentisphaerales bacterium]
MDSCTIELTSAAEKYGNLNIKPCGKDFFPSKSFGGSSKKSGLGIQITLKAEGLNGPIKTDIPTDNKTGRPRWIFRDRSWVKKFLERNKLNAGDKLIIIRTGHTEYRISPLWRQFKFIDLFAGIGGMRLAFEAVGGKCVFSSEIDSLAQDTYEANFGDRPAGDITKIPPDSVPNHDILIAGFPCQAFSIIGNRKGFSDIRGTLFFNIEEILKAKRPSALLLENVKQFLTHDNGRTYQTVIHCLHELGYHTHTKVLNALNYGVPQKRERTFIVGFQKNFDFSFPEPFAYLPNLGGFLEKDDEVDPKLFASDYIR